MAAEKGEAEALERALEAARSEWETQAEKALALGEALALALALARGTIKIRADLC